MKKGGILIILMCSCFIGFSQSVEDLLNALDDSDQVTSYVKVGVGIGNNTFSVQNNALNSMNTFNSAVLTPSVGYFHKSGLSLTATGYALMQSGNSGFLQYALTPAYELPENKHIRLELSYSHYFVTNQYSPSSTPIQNEFYGSISSKKGIIQPGVALGYANGKYKDLVPIDTIVRNIHYKFTDTTTTNLTSFSLIPYVEHEFMGTNLFTKRDEWLFSPQLMVNTGTSKETQVSSSTIAFTAQGRGRRGGRTGAGSRTNKSTYSSGFQVQSIALSLGGGYGIGKFTVEPNIYLDYYLPATTYNRFTQVYSLIVSYSF